jgi:hypothetical protein
MEWIWKKDNPLLEAGKKLLIEVPGLIFWLRDRSRL